MLRALWWSYEDGLLRISEVPLYMAGSGKTVAFLVPLIVRVHRLPREEETPQNGQRLFFLNAKASTVLHVPHYG